MDGKQEPKTAAVDDIDERLWRAFFHRQYDTGTEGRIRREYMELAKQPFYSKVLEILKVNPYETVLDEGCGDGRDIVLLKERGHKGLIVGVETPVPEDEESTDDKAELIRANVAKVGAGRVDISIGYAEELDFPDESFDLIWVANTLQHCYDIDRVIDNNFRMLKDGGRMVVITNHTDNKPIHHAILREMAAKVGGVAPAPLSSKFNSVTGPQIMSRHRHQFRCAHQVIQKGTNNLRLTAEELPTLLASLSTYWADIRPVNTESITKEELLDFLRNLYEKRYPVIKDVERKLLAQIDASPDKAIYETIKRVGYIYDKRPHTLSSTVLRSQVAIQGAITKKLT